MRLLEGMGRCLLEQGSPLEAEDTVGAADEDAPKLVKPETLHLWTERDLVLLGDDDGTCRPRLATEERRSILERLQQPAHQRRLARKGAPGQHRERASCKKALPEPLRLGRA
jgi:hypothetical protein